MIYPLSALLSVRHYREDSAKNDVLIEEKKLKLEKEKFKKLEDEVFRYKEKMPELVEAEYAKIIGKKCKMKDIDITKEEVAKIEQVLVDKEIKLEAQKQVLVASEESLQKAKIALNFARKEASKIEKHKEIWSEIAKKEAERLEDLELEEFSTHKELD